MATKQEHYDYLAKYAQETAITRNDFLQVIYFSLRDGTISLDEAKHFVASSGVERNSAVQEFMELEARIGAKRRAELDSGAAST